MSYGTKKILLIGNGFDLRTGVKTTFREFFRFVLYGVIWHNYHKSKLLKHQFIRLFENKSAKECLKTYYKVKLNNKVTDIAEIQRKKENDNSKHPLEILLALPHREQKIITENCRKLIDTEFGKYFFKQILKHDRYLFDALRVNEEFNRKTEFLFHDALNKLVAVVYGFADDFNKMVFQDPERHVENTENTENEKIKEACNTILDTYSKSECLQTIAEIVETSLDKNRNNIALWSDVETVIELLVTRDKNLKTKYNLEDDDLPKWNDETLKSFSEGLEIFELLLTKYFKAIQNIDINIIEFFGQILNGYSESLHLRSLFSKDQARTHLKYNIIEPDIIINYNYTDIAERIYEGKQKVQNSEKPSCTEGEEDVFWAIKHDRSKQTQCIHINGALEPKYAPSKEGLTTNIVIGYTNLNNSDVPKELYHFEKTSRRIVKNTEYFDLEQHIKDFAKFDLLIVGHSCCPADSDVIGDLLKHDKLNNALVLCHSKDNLISINNNIRHILRTTPTKYGELMTHRQDKFSHNLFYAVEQTMEPNKNPEENKANLEASRDNIDKTKKKMSAIIGEVGKKLTRLSRKIVKTAQ